MSEIPLKDDTEAWTEAIAALRSLSAEVNAGFLALSKNDLDTLRRASRLRRNSATHCAALDSSTPKN